MKSQEEMTAFNFVYVLHEVSVKYLFRDVGLKKLLGLWIEIWESLTQQQCIYGKRQNHWDSGVKIWSKDYKVKVSGRKELVEYTAGFITKLSGEPSQGKFMAKDFSRKCVQSEISKAPENLKKMTHKKNQLLKSETINKKFLMQCHGWNFKKSNNWWLLT